MSSIAAAATTATTLEERNAIRDAVRDLMAARSSEAAVRATMDSAEGYDPEVWAALVEMGIPGLLVVAEFGGAGFGPLEVELVMEETGAALLCSPLVSSGVLAAALLARSGDLEACERLLPGIAGGSTIATVALTGEAGTWTPAGVDVIAGVAGGGPFLDGVASYVTHGQIATALLVVARTPDGIGIFEVVPGAAGLTIAPLPTFDRTLRLARLEFSRTPAHRIGAAGWPAVESALRVALVALGGEQVGGARRIFEMTLEYAKVRVQFGRAIGGFQAIKHMAADLLLEVESATSAARDAAQQLAEGSKTAGEAVSLAAFVCADAFSNVAATAIQMHGGIAFTWEHPAHLYLRRARALAQLFGTPQFYRERFLRHLAPDDKWP